MTNYECLIKNRPELVKGVLTGATGVAKVNGEVVRCVETPCCECDFSNGESCRTVKEQWLDEEHTEKPLPCPCCGRGVRVSSDFIGWYFIRCACGIETKCDESIDELLKVWNTRVGVK